MKTTRALMTALTVLPTASVLAQVDSRYDGVFINEVFYDPAGDFGDFSSEYIELRGTPGLSLSDHYLVILENENGRNATLGHIEMIFDLGGRSVGTNGYLTLRQKGSPYSSVAPGTSDQVNTGFSAGYGSGAGSSIGATDEGGEGTTENSGGTMLLVRRDDVVNAPPPFLNLDLDTNDDGRLDSVGGINGWTILDSIAYVGEPEGRNFGTFSPTVFSPPADTADDQPGGPTVEPGAEKVIVSYGEVEYVGRWGTSIGSSASGWLAANLSDRAEAGFIDPNTGYVVSGVHDSEGGTPSTRNPEVNHGYTANAVPYGRPITNTLGRPNYPIPDGDLSQDTRVNADDLNIVLANWNQNKPQQRGFWLGGDPSGDGATNADDLNTVLANWNASGGGNGSAMSVTKETAERSTHLLAEAKSGEFVEAPSLPGHVTNDLRFSTDSDWLSAQILVELSDGDFYQNAFNGNTAPPLAAIVAAFPDAAFDTYVKGADDGETASTAGGAANIGGGTDARFESQLLDVTWFTNDTDDIGVLTLGRFTLTDNATGTFTVRLDALDGSGFESVVLTGQIVNGRFVIPEPSTVGLAALSLAGLNIRRRRN